MNFRQLCLALTIGGVIMTSSVKAETLKLEFPAASPSCTLKQRAGITDFEIEYSRPSVKGRQIFGSLVPYGKVWRTGANGATKIKFNTPIKMNGKEIPAGTYALMTIPGENEWTVIINKGTEQWGAYKYDEAADVARFTTKPSVLDKQLDTFTIEFNDLRDDSANLNLAWDKVCVPVKIEFDYVAKLEKEISTVMASDEPKKPYFQAAKFYFDHDKDLKLADKWVDEAIKERGAFFTVYLKAQILEKMGDKAGALTASKRSLEMAQKANDNAYIKQNEALIERLK